MIYVNWAEINELATKQKGMFSVYVSNGLNYDKTDSHIWSCILFELDRLYTKGSCKYNNLTGQLIIGGLFFFETEEKAEDFYSIFCKEGVDSSAVYASYYSPIDGCLTENT